MAIRERVERTRVAGGDDLARVPVTGTRLRGVGDAAVLEKVRLLFGLWLGPGGDMVWSLEMFVDWRRSFFHIHITSQSHLTHRHHHSVEFLLQGARGHAPQNTFFGALPSVIFSKLTLFNR